MSVLRDLWHLVRRFVDHLWHQLGGGSEPAAADIVWVHAQLTDGEAALFDTMASVDRHHSIAVGRAVEGYSTSSPGSAWVLVAALTHDVGKGTVRLGVLGRVAGTVAGSLRLGARSDLTPRSWLGRVRAYPNYPAAGARLLDAEGSDWKVVAWAREHHEPEASWTVPVADGRILAAADDGRL